MLCILSDIAMESFRHVSSFTIDRKSLLSQQSRSRRAGDRYHYLGGGHVSRTYRNECKEYRRNTDPGPRYGAIAASHAHVRSDASVYSLWVLSAHLSDIRCAGRRDGFATWTYLSDAGCSGWTPR